MAQACSSPQLLTEFPPHTHSIHLPRGSHLYRKGNIFYFRQVLSASLRERFSRTEIRLSLKTAYVREARERAAHLYSLFTTIVEMSPMLSYAEIKSRLNRLLALRVEQRGQNIDPYALVLGPDEYGTLTSKSILTLNRYVLKNKHFRTSVHELMQLQARTENEDSNSVRDTDPVQKIPPGFATHTDLYTTLAENMAAFLAENEYFSAEEIENNKALIGKCLAQMEIDLSNFVVADEQGEYTASLKLQRLLDETAPTSVNATGDSAQKQASPLLSEAAKQYFLAKEGERAWKSTSSADIRNRLGFFLEIVEDKPIAEITRNDVREFRSVLEELPPNYKKSKKYAGKTPREIAAMKPEQKLSVASVNLALEAAGSFFQWCIEEGLTIANPAKKINIRDTRQAVDLRDAFSVEELQRIFIHPKFTAGKFANPAYFWIPLIGLFSGMRLEEIAQLHVADVYESKEQGIWVMDVNDKGQDENGLHKSVKNRNSVRVVPLHDSLIQLGLLQYHTNVREKKHVRLFPQLSRTGKTVKYGKQPGKQFKAVVDAVLQDSGKKSFHSLRHTFADFYKQRNLQNDMFTRLYGHGLEKLAARQYGGDFPPETLYREVIARLDYGLDLSGVAADFFLKF